MCVSERKRERKRERERARERERERESSKWHACQDMVIGNHVTNSPITLLTIQLNT